MYEKSTNKNRGSCANKSFGMFLYYYFVVGFWWFRSFEYLPFGVVDAFIFYLILAVAVVVAAGVECIMRLALHSSLVQINHNTQNLYFVLFVFIS